MSIYIKLMKITNLAIENINEVLSDKDISNVKKRFKIECIVYQLLWDIKKSSVGLESERKFESQISEALRVRKNIIFPDKKGGG